MEWEFAILDMLQEMHHPVLTKIMAFVTMLGEAGWFWILLGVILLCTKRFRKCGVAVLLALVLDFLLANVILKPLVARPRPCWINDTVELLVRVPKDYSFPSGHTCAAFSAGLVWARTLPKTWMRRTAVIQAVLMGLSRLYVGVHYPSDVLGGALVGTVCAMLALYIGRLWQRRQEHNLQ